MYTHTHTHTHTHAYIYTYVFTNIYIGADVVLDGRGVQVAEYPHGNFVGPTVISNVDESMRCYQVGERE